jgi:hypothetical protein
MAEVPPANELQDEWREFIKTEKEKEYVPSPEGRNQKVFSNPSEREFLLHMRKDCGIKAALGFLGGISVAQSGFWCMPQHLIPITLLKG